MFLPGSVARVTIRLRTLLKRTIEKTVSTPAHARGGGSDALRQLLSTYNSQGLYRFDVRVPPSRWRAPEPASAFHYEPRTGLAPYKRLRIPVTHCVTDGTHARFGASCYL